MPAIEVSFFSSFFNWLFVGSIDMMIVTLFRFLKDSDFSEDIAVERLVDTIQWRKDEKISRMTYQSIAAEFFENGFAFFHKQDLIGRPVAVIQMRHFPKFREKNRPLSDFMQPFACLVMEIARQMTRDLTRKNEKDQIKDKPVLISQISIIIDIQKAPFVPIDSNLMHSLKNITNTRFPGFVGSVYIMNFGWMYQGIWQVVKLVLSEQAKARVNFISGEEIKQVIDENDCLKGRLLGIWLSRYRLTGLYDSARWQRQLCLESGFRLDIGPICHRKQIQNRRTIIHSLVPKLFRVVSIVDRQQHILRCTGLLI